MSREPKSTPRRIKARLRQSQAFELKLAGASFQQIADQLGYSSKSGAERAYRTQLERLTIAPSEESKKLQLERLEHLFLAMYTQAKSGALGATDRCIRIIQEIAKLQGLYAPTMINVNWREEAERAGLSAGDLFEDLVGVIAEKMREDAESTSE